MFISWRKELSTEKLITTKDTNRRYRGKEGREEERKDDPFGEGGREGGERSVERSPTKQAREREAWLVVAWFSRRRKKNRRKRRRKRGLFSRSRPTLSRYRYQPR